MVELADANGLPIVVVMALQAVRPQPAFVMVLMASRAGRRYAQVRLAQVFDLDGGAFSRRNVIGGMALVTSHARMFAFEHVAGLLVIEGLDVPLNQRKSLAVVVGVAVHAILTRIRLDVVGSMQAFVRCHPSSDLGMTRHAVKSRFAAGEYVAGRAVFRSAEGLVRPRQGTWRNLRGAGNGSERPGKQGEDCDATDSQDCRCDRLSANPCATTDRAAAAYA